MGLKFQYKSGKLKFYLTVKNNKIASRHLIIDKEGWLLCSIHSMDYDMLMLIVFNYLIILRYIFITKKAPMHKLAIKK